MLFIAGIEEAGRGPVIGPMVMAIAVIDSEQEIHLKEIGVKDSKQVSPKRREILFDQLVEMLHVYKIEIVPPKDIDAVLEARNSNLNQLEADISIKLAKSLEEKVQISRIILDCPSTNTLAYQQYICSRLKINPDCIISEHKADVNYPIVSAASILAKVTRDREIKKLQEEYNVDFGSGYTSDKKTIQFLRRWVKKYGKLPDFVRENWATAKNILNEMKQRKLDDY
jgi:ribonuclease HII